MAIKHNKLSENVLTLDGFLSVAECEEFIKKGEAIGFEEATVNLHSGPAINKGIRNNTRIMMKDYELADELYNRALPYLPPTMLGNAICRFNEMARFYKYVAGQYFRSHRDGCYRTETEESFLSLLIYLNNTPQGGETRVEETVVNTECIAKRYEHIITPKAGTALVFPHPLRHEGCPIISGEKYVLRFDVMYEMKQQL
jgi:prolyl 4-hydroxylase